jgi:hypothetical protein
MKIDQFDWFSEPRLKSYNPAWLSRPIFVFVKIKIMFLSLKNNKHLIDRACSVRIGGIGLMLILSFYWPCLQLSPHKRKKTVLDQYDPPFSTLRSVNNLYIWTFGQ